ncbi:MAG TPA: hypothetical protein VFO48_11530 [Vicinamibacterales bacterium]|nr:hypothetical protein [Vicinamibacterales bacterium]
MRTYIVTTGAMFALITLAHLWRIIVEGSHLFTDPFFVLATLVSASLSFWAWRLFRRSTQSGPT